MRYRKVSILIPAYNEERTIDAALRAVAAVDLSLLGLTREIIVVDDGSRDRTEEIIRAGHPEVSLVRHERNRGKGSALRTGMAHATGDLILVQDADLEYDPCDYPALLRPLVDGTAEVVFGSRFLARRWPRGMHVANFVGNKWLTLLANALYGLAITDEATCYKVFDASLLRSLPLACTGFDFCPEVVAQLGWRGIHIAEVPVAYSGRGISEGKKVGWRDAITATRVLLRHRFAAQGRPHQAR